MKSPNVSLKKDTKSTKQNEKAENYKTPTRKFIFEQENVFIKDSRDAWECKRQNHKEKA